MLVVASRTISTSRTSETIAPLWRRNRRRTIWPWLSPATSFCSRLCSSSSTGTSPGSCAGSWGSWISVIERSVRDPDPRVEHGVQQVGEQVGDDGEDGDRRRRTPSPGSGRGRCSPSVNIRPIAFHSNTVSVITAPPRMPPMSKATIVASGIIALRKPWRTIDGALGQALGPRRADVVLVEHLEHARSRVPRVGGQRDQHQRQRRQDEVAERVVRDDPEAALEPGSRGRRSS